jgi:hypothetical protein
VAIIGTHVLLCSSEPEALRETLRDAFGWTGVDAGGGWLILALPPGEIGVHPTEDAPKHLFSLMCDDLEATTAELSAKGIRFVGELEDAPWGIAATMLLPGDVEVQVYQPRHATAI